jgi:hypothetical protein
MAERSEVRTEVKGFSEYAHVISWTGLLNGDTGVPVEMPGSHIRSVQILGMFGVGGTIVLEGSNDGTNYVTLTDPQGNAISKTSAGIEQVQEATRFIRPRVTAGDLDTSLSVYTLVKRIR